MGYVTFGDDVRFTMADFASFSDADLFASQFQLGDKVTFSMGKHSSYFGDESSSFIAEAGTNISVADFGSLVVSSGSNLRISSLLGHGALVIEPGAILTIAVGTDCLVAGPSIPIKGGTKAVWGSDHRDTYVLCSTSASVSARKPREGGKSASRGSSLESSGERKQEKATHISLTA